MSEKIKSPRNKTIELDDAQKKIYFSRCAKLCSKAELAEVTDRTICGDSLAIMPLLPEKSCDLIIVDPPYNLAKEYDGEHFSSMSSEAYREFTLSWLNEVIRLLKPEGSLYVCCDWRSSLVIGQVLCEKLNVRNRISWQREKGRGAAKNWKNSMEDIWFATAGKDYYFALDAVKQRRKVIAPYRVDGKPKDWVESENGSYRDSCPSNFWDDITVPYWSMPENTPHPAQKPEKLLAKLILASSKEGDIVFDPFLGSGSTSVTAKKLGRHYIGIEKSELYCALAEKRLELADSDRTIQGFEDGIFYERNTQHRAKKKE